eukprot:COSAG02_NODE_1046_length_14984_cov_12.231844_6_plen_40_part_00
MHASSANASGTTAEEVVSSNDIHLLENFHTLLFFHMAVQ